MSGRSRSTITAENHVSISITIVSKESSNHWEANQAMTLEKVIRSIMSNSAKQIMGETEYEKPRVKTA